VNKTVAIVINTTWNIYNFRLGLLKALQKKGYRVIAIAPNDSYSKKLENEGIEHYDIEINNQGTNPIEDIRLVYKFYKLYKSLSPDIILQYTIKPNIYGSIAGGILGIPIISNISGLGTVFLNDSFSSKIAKILYKVALIIPKKVFFQNSDDRKLFISSKLVNKKKTDLLPGSGIDIKKFRPIKVENDNKSIKFLFIARLVKDKGLVEYIEASKIINNLKLKIENYQKPKFDILGAFYSGNPTAITTKEMKKWEKEGIVRYLGTSDNVKFIIAQYDCIVLPSYREGLSRVLLEAASMAKPIITTDTTGCRDVVEDGVNGYLCKVKDVKSLAEQMRKIIFLSKEEKEKMGTKGREKIKKEFDEKIVIQKYLESIDKILKG